jgi:hypothetical protein
VQLLMARAFALNPGGVIPVSMLSEASRAAARPVEGGPAGRLGVADVRFESLADLARWKSTMG